MPSAYQNGAAGSNNGSGLIDFFECGPTRPADRVKGVGQAWTNAKLSYWSQRYF